LPAALPLITPMSAADELQASQTSTPLHHCYHGDHHQQQQQQQQWGLGQIQRGLTSEYCMSYEVLVMSVYITYLI